MSLFIGLISGTSIDAVDAVVLEVGASPPAVIARASFPIPDDLRDALHEIATDPRPDAREAWRLDARLGHVFADSVSAMLAAADVGADRIAAIGCHGQTVFHDPDGDPPCTVQIGDPNVIAERTGITTIADFRRRDVAAGGQGAPLVPGFHAAVFSAPATPRAILNAGGIANLSILSGDPEIATRGFDTGPANTLLDAWARRHLSRPLDADGGWATGGTVIEPLLERCLDEPYLLRAPPKSTGRELFNLAWLDPRVKSVAPLPSPIDVQRTLVELTAVTVAQAIESFASETREIYVCGGGANNRFLMERLVAHLAPRPTLTTDALGIPPDCVEAAAFAWLASKALAGEAGNVPEVTGAARPVILGGVYRGASR